MLSKFACTAKINVLMTSSIENEFVPFFTARELRRLPESFSFKILTPLLIRQSILEGFLSIGIQFLCFRPAYRRQCALMAAV